MTFHLSASKTACPVYICLCIDDDQPVCVINKIRCEGREGDVFDLEARAVGRRSSPSLTAVRKVGRKPIKPSSAHDLTRYTPPIFRRSLLPCKLPPRPIYRRVVVVSSILYACSGMTLISTSPPLLIQRGLLRLNT